MRKYITLLIVLLLVCLSAARVKAASAQENKPVVHAVLFWTNGCQFCEQTLTTVLPPIQRQYQSQLSIRLIELASSEDVDNFYTFGASLGLSKEQVSVPFLLIDHTMLIGVDKIKADLPGLVDKYLAAGGIAYPDSPLLFELFPKGVDFASQDYTVQIAPQIATAPNQSGMTLAWIIMVLMWLALILAIVMIWRAFQGRPLGELKGWAEILIPILAFLGLVASIYLTYVELTHVQAICGPVGDCNTVQSSPYAKLFGVLPIGLLGAIGYIAISLSWLWRRFRKDNLSKIAGPAAYAMALFGTLFSIYLTYLELFVIHAVCIWCLSSAVIITVLMLLCLPALTRWLAIADEEE